MIPTKIWSVFACYVVFLYGISLAGQLAGLYVISLAGLTCDYVSCVFSKTLQ